MTYPISNTTFLIGPEDADTACLLIHGFSGSPSEMRGLGDVLADHGIRVLGVVLAGHEGNPEGLLHIGYKQWLASAEAGLAQLAQYPRVFIAGLSLGGVISLLLAGHYPERVTGVIVMSTPTYFAGGWQVKVLPLARYFIKWFYPLATLDYNNPKVQEEVLHQARLRNPGRTIDFSDPKALEQIKKAIRLPVSAIDEVMRLTNRGRKRLGLVHSPLLIIHSKKDQTVSPVCAEELYQLASAASPKSLHWLERSDHVITLGPEKEEVYQLATTFIEATVHAAVKTALSGAAHLDEVDGTCPGH